MHDSAGECQVWRKVGETHTHTRISLLPADSLPRGGGEEGSFLAVKLHQYSGMGNGHLRRHVRDPDVGKNILRVLLEGPHR